MTESGCVVELDGDIARVKFARSSMCAKCGACGMGNEQRDITVSVPNTLGAVPGDQVQVQFASRNALASSAIGYLFPLLMLFVGVLIGYAIPQIGPVIPDAMAAILGLVFAVGSFFILKALNPVFRRKFSNVYTMTSILGPQEN